MLTLMIPEKKNHHPDQASKNQVRTIDTDMTRKSTKLKDSTIPTPIDTGISSSAVMVRLKVSPTTASPLHATRER